MCGIIGYVGQEPAKEILLYGIQELQERGYDSAGIAVVSQEGDIFSERRAGKVTALREAISQREIDQGFVVPGTVGIGHTRWATHGGVTDLNAHPHFDEDREFYVVHNGVIENNAQLREFLEERGHSFYSETDSEVIPKLIAEHFRESGDVEEAFVKTIEQLAGGFAIGMTTSHQPDRIYGARFASMPLLIGRSEDAHMLASDQTAMNGHASDSSQLGNADVIVVEQEGYRTLASLGNTQHFFTPLVAKEAVNMGDHPTFMHKEIYEAGETIENAIRGRLNLQTGEVKLGGIESVLTELREKQRILIVACGTSYFAGKVGEGLLEKLAGIPVETQVASEFKYGSQPVFSTDAIIAISQSGETADLIGSLEHPATEDNLKLGIVNTPGSSIDRMTQAGIHCRAGHEKAVASTKAFIAQSTALTLLAMQLSNEPQPELAAALGDLPALAKKVLQTEDEITALAKKYSGAQRMIFLGRQNTFPVAEEGALKLKEISYIHAEAYQTGELKHGPLALIDEGTPTVVVAPTNGLLDKTASNIQEIKARGGPVIAVVDSLDNEVARLADDVILIPECHEDLQPILSVIPLHMFAYHVADSLGRDIDQPRNLAKSVTVE